MVDFESRVPIKDPAVAYEIIQKIFNNLTDRRIDNLVLHVNTSDRNLMLKILPFMKQNISIHIGDLLRNDIHISPWEIMDQKNLGFYSIERFSEEKEGYFYWEACKIEKISPYDKTA